MHTSWQLANKSDRPHRQCGGLRGNIWIGLSKAQRVGGGWGGAEPVFAADYSSFRSPLEEVNAIIASQV